MASNAAGDTVDIKHIEILSKVHSPWLTAAIEISEANFNAVNNGLSWEDGLAIRPFLGRRYWRLPRRLTKAETRSSVKMTWAEEQ